MQRIVANVLLIALATYSAGCARSLKSKPLVRPEIPIVEQNSLDVPVSKRIGGTHGEFGNLTDPENLEVVLEKLSDGLKNVATELEDFPSATEAAKPESSEHSVEDGTSESKRLKINSPEGVAQLKKGLRLMQKEFDDARLQLAIQMAKSIPLENVKYECEDPRPMVHSIDSKSILIFEEPALTTNPAPLVIPIEGKDLFCKDVRVSVQVISRPRNIREDEYRWGRANSMNLLPLEILPSFLKRVEDGAELEVLLVFEAHSKGKPRFVSFASRTFTLYSTKYYRDFILRKRIPTYAIKAFPQTEVDARALFGPYVAENYFSVKISVENPTDQDILLHSGMIKATGRAIVQKDLLENGKKVEVVYTVPVVVSPQSLAQVYTVLDDEEENQPRSRLFRSLDFIGALGTASAAAFGASLDLTKGIGLFTGVAVPAAKDVFWKNRWPGYKRNVVNFGMQDLHKISRGQAGEAAHKYLFFPKKEIETIVSESHLFTLEPSRGGSFLDPAYYKSSRKDGKKLTGPSVSVVSLAFDNLEIPYDKFSEPTEADSLGRVVSLQDGVRQQLRVLAASTNTQSEFNVGEFRVKLSDIDKLTADLQGIVEKNPDEKELLQSIEMTSKYLNQIKSGDAAKQLNENDEFGFTRLNALSAALNAAVRNSLGGTTASTYDKLVDSATAALSKSRNATAMYIAVASIAQTKEIAELIDKLKRAPNQKYSAALLGHLRTALETGGLQP